MCAYSTGFGGRFLWRQLDVLGEAENGSLGAGPDQLGGDDNSGSYECCPLAADHSNSWQERSSFPAPNGRGQSPARHCLINAGITDHSVAVFPAKGESRLLKEGANCEAIGETIDCISAPEVIAV